MNAPAEFDVTDEPDRPRLVLRGDWTAEAAVAAGPRLATALRHRAAPHIDLTAVGRIDTAGAHAILRALGGRIDPTRLHARPATVRLLELVETAMAAKSEPAPGSL